MLTQQANAAADSTANSISNQNDSGVSNNDSDGGCVDTDVLGTEESRALYPVSARVVLPQLECSRRERNDKRIEEVSVRLVQRTFRGERQRTMNEMTNTITRARSYW
jgi:hypothetical protein